MHNFFEKILKIVYSFAAFLLIFIAVLTMGWSAWEVVLHFNFDEQMTTRILQSVGVIVIAIAILDVAKYICMKRKFAEAKNFVRQKRQGRR